MNIDHKSRVIELDMNIIPAFFLATLLVLRMCGTDCQIGNDGRTVDLASIIKLEKTDEI